MAKDLSFILREMRKTVDRTAVVASRSPFKTLIATILSQRTRDQNTAKAASQLFEKHSAPKAIAGASLPELRKLVKPAGFYRVKALRIKEISRQIVERFNGKTPQSIEELVSLPGVGRKTANCVLVYGFGKPAMPVDVHVHRISNRIGLVKTRKPEQTEAALCEIVPKRNWLEFNHLMVRYGQTVCLPRNPNCSKCKIRPECSHFLDVVSKNQV